MTPSNTWSNLFYVLYALLMMRYMMRCKKKLRGLVRWFAPAAVFVGVTSGLYHASYTLFFQYWDFLGMYTFLALPWELSLRRNGSLKHWREGTFATLLITCSMMLTFVMASLRIPYQSIVLALIIGLLFLNSAFLDHAHLLVALSFIVLAAAFSAADQMNVYCEPESLLQGHAIWHALGSVSLYFLFLFFAK